MVRIKIMKMRITSARSGEQPAMVAMIMKVILTNVSCKKGAAMQEGEKRRKRERRIKNTRRDRPREMDGRLSLGEQGRECALSLSAPFRPPPPLVGGEKGREGNRGSSMDHHGTGSTSPRRCLTRSGRGGRRAGGGTSGER